MPFCKTCVNTKRRRQSSNEEKYSAMFRKYINYINVYEKEFIKGCQTGEIKAEQDQFNQNNFYEFVKTCEPFANKIENKHFPYPNHHTTRYSMGCGRFQKEYNYKMNSLYKLDYINLNFC